MGPLLRARCAYMIEIYLAKGTPEILMVFHPKFVKQPTLLTVEAIENGNNHPVNIKARQL